MFIKGMSGNPSGRKHGSQNKNKAQLKETIKAILEDNLSKLDAAQEQLTNAERIQFTKALLPFVMPKLNSVVVREGEPLGGFKTIDITLHNNENKDN